MQQTIACYVYSITFAIQNNEAMITKTQINFMVEAAIIIKNVSRIDAEKIVIEYIKEKNGR